MTTQQEKAQTFRALHRPGSPLVLVNIWDAGSAKAVAAAGAKSVAIASWAVAAAHGFEDGERIPLELALANAQRVVRATDLPVTMDLESGFGSAPADVAGSVAAAIRASPCVSSPESDCRNFESRRTAGRHARRSVKKVMLPGSQQTDESDDDQINGNDVVQHARHEKNQDSRKQGSDRSKG